MHKIIKDLSSNESIFIYSCISVASYWGIITGIAGVYDLYIEKTSADMIIYAFFFIGPVLSFFLAGYTHKLLLWLRNRNHYFAFFSIVIGNLGIVGYIANFMSKGF